MVGNSDRAKPIHDMSTQLQRSVKTSALPAAPPRGGHCVCVLYSRTGGLNVSSSRPLGRNPGCSGIPNCSVLPYEPTLALLIFLMMWKGQLLFRCGSRAFPKGGTWMLPETASLRLPVTEANVFLSPSSVRSPRKAKLIASLYLTVSLSTSTKVMGVGNMDAFLVSVSMRKVLRAPPPVTSSVFSRRTGSAELSGA